jgi:hypothetical protein
VARPGTAVRLTAIGVSAAYSLGLRLSGVKLDSGVKQVLAYVPVLAGVALVVFDAWLWRLAWVQRFLPRPRLDGLWAASLTPAADSHISDGGHWGPIEAYVCITQTFWSLAVRQYTAESRSDSCSSSIARRDDGQRFEVAFIYQNSPRQEHLTRSPRHFGGCVLDISGRTPTELNGFYFTDRFTKGDMDLRFIDRTSGHGSFSAAQKHAVSRRQ